MKKIILLALGLLWGGLVLAGCSENGEPFVTKDYTPETQIREITLDVRDREIEVSRSEDEQVHIEYAENSREYYKISVSEEHALVMTGATNKAWTDYIGRKPSVEDRKIALQIPNALLENLTISATNADIAVSKLSVAGNIDLSANHGNIVLENAEVGREMRLTVKNGDISGTVVGSYDEFAIRTKVKKGACNLPEHKDGGAKRLNVSGNNGDVSVEFVQANRAVEVYQ